jgi:hypothetical protein
MARTKGKGLNHHDDGEARGIAWRDSSTPSLPSTSTERAFELYGSLKEGVHVAGYTLERAWNHLECLLEEDCWKALGFDDINTFLDNIRLDHFRILAEQRKRIANRIKELQPEASNRAIARTIGVDDRTIRRDHAANAAPRSEKPNENKDALIATAANAALPALSGAEAAKIVGREQKKTESANSAKQRREASRNAPALPDGMDYRIGDCREVLADIPGSSVPLILTDPPYGDEAEPLYRWLADFAARVLIPGGSLICYTGHSRLNRDHAIFSTTLRYWWELSMPHDQTQRLPGKFVIVGWRPILWYVKEFRRGRSLMPDVLKSISDKTQHPWSQGTGGVEYIIEHLTEPGELIVDPFAGTATWGRIAVGMGRRWIGADIVEGGSTHIVGNEPLDPGDMRDPPQKAPAAEPPPPDDVGDDVGGDDDGDGLDLPDFLRIENRKPLTPEQQAKADEAMAKARKPEQAKEDLRKQQAKTKKEKSRVRIEKLKARKSGDAAKVPLQGKAALAHIKQGGAP